MLDGDHEPLALDARGEECARPLDTGLVGGDPERVVRPQHPREQARLAKDLEAVADPENRPSFGSEAADRRGGEAGDRLAAQVVAVEKTRQDDAAEVARESAVAVPGEKWVGAEARGAPKPSRSSFDPGNTITAIRGRGMLTSSSSAIS